MEIGMIGLGRMGANLVRRLMRAGHQCVVYDVSPKSVTAMAQEGAVGAASLAELVAKLKAPRAIWMMVPAGAVEATLNDLSPLLQKGDIVIDGGNSYYIDDMRRAKDMTAKQIHYLD